MSMQKINYKLEKKFLIFLICWLIVLAWICLLLIIIVMFIGSFSNDNWFANFAFIPLLIALTVFSFLAAILAGNIKCAACGSKFLISGTDSNYRSLRKLWEINPWAKSIVNLLIYKKAKCLNCSEENMLP